MHKFYEAGKIENSSMTKGITEAAEVQENIQQQLDQMALSQTDSEKSIDFVVDLIKKDADTLYMFSFDRILHKNPAYSIKKIIDLLDRNGQNEWQFPSLVVLMTDLVGVEVTRKKLDELIDENPKDDEEMSNNLSYARSLITPELKPAKIDKKTGELITEDKDKEKIEHIISLRNFYNEKIKFEDYAVNERMNVKEVELLQSLIGKDEKVLEEGCGTGRLFLEMKKAGYDITGFDFTDRHVDLVKQKDPAAKVTQDDWHKTKFEDASFDTVYSLGRNILHDYSLPDQAQLFREAARILKPNGKFIFDIPNREKGGYREMTEEYAREMKERGIRNFRYGTIYDSPNGTDFATRYAYSPEDIEQLAQLAGFKIMKVEKRELETGKEDENLYFVLEKINKN